MPELVQQSVKAAFRIARSIAGSGKGHGDVPLRDAFGGGIKIKALTQPSGGFLIKQKLTGHHIHKGIKKRRRELSVVDVRQKLRLTLVDEVFKAGFISVRDGVAQHGQPGHHGLIHGHHCP